MAVTNAVILIPDISGFTHFFSNVEIEHGAEIIDALLATMMREMQPYFTINEIEGDALLAYRHGLHPNGDQLLLYCNRIFHAFHTEKTRLMESINCRCSACSGIDRLAVKFVGHYGRIALTNVMGFEKAFGMDMIIAHRLLKNDLASSQYILFTHALMGAIRSAEAFDTSWHKGEAAYDQIGTVHYQYQLLSLHQSCATQRNIVNA